MTFFSRALLLFITGIVQIFFAAHLLFNWTILDLPSDLMFIPGILVLLTSAVLTIDYYFGNKDNRVALYDEYIADRYDGPKDTDSNAEALHRGIAKRAFKLKFTLAEDLEVLGASLKNGLLTIDMERVVPDHKKPRSIEVK